MTASGSTMENPAAAYYKVLRDPDAVMENTTQLFLAIRFNCNKCHDHPFERWTQDQYYQMAAFFARIGRKEDPKYKGQKVGGTAVTGAAPLVEIIADVDSGEVKHERTGAVKRQHRRGPRAERRLRDALNRAPCVGHGVGQRPAPHRPVPAACQTVPQAIRRPVHLERAADRRPHPTQRRGLQVRRVSRVGTELWREKPRHAA